MLKIWYYADIDYIMGFKNFRKQRFDSISTAYHAFRREI